MIDPAPLFSVMSKYNESPPYNKYKILKSLVPEYCVIKNTIDFEERHLCCQKHRLKIPPSASLYVFHLYLTHDLERIW